MARTLLQGTVLLAIAAVTVSALAATDVMPQDIEIMLDILRAQEIVPLPADKQPGHCPSWLHNATEGQEWLDKKIHNLTDEDALTAFATAYGSYFPDGFNVTYYLHLWHDEAIKDGSLDLSSLSGFFPTEAPTTAPTTEPTTTHETTPAPTTETTTTHETTTTTRAPTTETTTTTRAPTTETTTTTTTMPPTTETTTTTRAPTTETTTTTRAPTTETTTTPHDTPTPTPSMLRSVRRLLQAVVPATPSPTQLEANFAEILRRNLIQLLVVEREVAFDDRTKDCVTRRYPEATLPPVAPTTTVAPTTVTVAPTTETTTAPMTTAAPITTSAPVTTASPNTTAAPNTTAPMPNTTATLTPFTTTGSHAPTTTSATTSTAAPTTSTASPTTTAPSGGITFPYPPAVASAYANDRVYKAIYDAVASTSLQVVLPLPAGCPATLASAASAQNLFESLVDSQTDVRTIVTEFLRNHTIDNFNSEAFIAYFAQTTMPGMMAAHLFIDQLTNSSNTTMPLTTTGTATAPASTTTSMPPPPTSATTAAPTTGTPSPTPEAAVMVSELDIMKNGNARMQLLQSYGVCFVSNPNATFPEPTQTEARVFNADISDGATFSVDFFRAQLTQYFAANGVVPEFNVSVSGNQVTITILSSGDVGAVAAAALLQMPAGQQTNLGIRNLAAAAEPSTPAPAEEKKSKLWIIGVVVGGIVVVAIIALVITRRRRARGTSAGVGAFDSELNASSEFHRTEYNRV